MEQRWIPVSERLPDADKYILVSFENFTISDIGRYETDKDGSGAFYPGDDDKSYVEYGLFVNAWMPLPEPYRESEENFRKQLQKIPDRLKRDVCTYNIALRYGMVQEKGDYRSRSNKRRMRIRCGVCVRKHGKRTF